MSRSLIEAWSNLKRGTELSDGEVYCEYGHEIRRGSVVWWSPAHPEYDECSAYCQRHAIERAKGDREFVKYCETTLGREAVK